MLKYCGGTTNLWNHLKFKHGYVSQSTETESSESKSKSTRITKFLTSRKENSIKKYDLTSERQKEITGKLIRFIAKHYEPFSLVDDPDFKSLLEALNPSYNVPSSKTLKRKMEDTYEKVYIEVKKFVNDPDNKLCGITADNWTSSTQNESYMSLTGTFITPTWDISTRQLEVKSCPGSHTAENLAAHLEEASEDWNIDLAETAIVTDSGANIKKATSLLKCKLSLNCLDHMLQCAVLKALKDDTADKILKTARRIVSHFQHSPLQSANLKEEAGKCENLSFCKLKQECPTRWGSTYEMLKRLLQMKKPVLHVLMESRKKEIRNLTPDADYWMDAQLICDLLENVHLISTQMCGEQYCTSSSVYAVVMNLLTWVMKPKDEDTYFIRNMKIFFSEYLEERLSDERIRWAMEVSAVVDPRMKDLPFVTEESRKKAYKSVKGELDRSMNKDTVGNEMSDECDDIEIIEDNTVSNSAARDRRLEILFGSKSFGCYGTKPKLPKTKITSKVALNSYLAEDSISLSEDPLAWWRENESKHPEMAKIARFFLGIPATSVSSERAFSTAGLITTEKRNRLKPKTVRMLHFLCKNL